MTRLEAAVEGTYCDKNDKNKVKIFILLTFLTSLWDSAMFQITLHPRYETFPSLYEVNYDWHDFYTFKMQYIQECQNEIIDVRFTDDFFIIS